MKLRFAFLYLLLAAVALGSAFVTGLEIGTKPAKIITKQDARPRISAQASVAQVEANFTGKPYVHAELSELPGFDCKGWTNGDNSGGWVVIRCELVSAP